MTKRDLDKILKLHKLWINACIVGLCAYLRNADLSNADLSNTNLSGADLSGADLSYADLRDANLSNTNLSYANLSNADLRDAGFFDFESNTLCEFYFAYNIEYQIIRVGCKTHTVLEWESYIYSKEDLYLDNCTDKKSHDKCINEIKRAIKLITKEN